MYIRELDLDESFVKFPSKLRREWQIAQGRLLSTNMMTKEDLAEFHSDPVSEEVAQTAYDNVMTGLNSRYSLTQRQMGTSLLPDLLLEKAFDLDSLTKTASLSKTESELISASDSVIRKGSRFS